MGTTPESRVVQASLSIIRSISVHVFDIILVGSQMIFIRLKVLKQSLTKRGSGLRKLILMSPVITTSGV